MSLFISAIDPCFRITVFHTKGTVIHKVKQWQAYVPIWFKAATVESEPLSIKIHKMYDSIFDKIYIKHFTAATE